jgi:hypothetical protein
VSALRELLSSEGEDRELLALAQEELQDVTQQVAECERE